ncbi:MAG TPA: hypothetical protein VHP30_00310, partial [Ignavibacteriales bacterium]|nr:hypothetical protein [Ignavibacteriales bacterium]
DNTKTGSNDRIPVNIEMDTWELPMIFQIGVSTNIIKTENYRALIAAAAVHPTNDFESVNVGGEFAFMDVVTLRGGYQSLFLDDAEGGLTLGIGVNSKMLFSDAIVKFDYAYRDYGRLKDVHSFSVSMAF